MIYRRRRGCQGYGSLRIRIIRDLAKKRLSPAPAPAPRIAHIAFARGKRRLTKAPNPDSIRLVIGNTHFKFLARDTVPPTWTTAPMLVAGKPELREYIPTRRDVVADKEVSQFSDEITVNCAPLV